MDTVVVDGRVLMRHRQIEGEAEVRARAWSRPPHLLLTGARFSRDG